MEDQVFAPSNTSEKMVLTSRSHFIILNVLTFNLYTVWWTYKSWRFFRDYQEADVEPAMRALFSILFLYSLFEKIKYFALSQKLPVTYSSVLLYLGVLIFSVLSYLPVPYFLMSLFAIIFYFPAIDALNLAVMSSSDYDSVVQTNFNSRQISLIVIGGIFWMFILLAVMMS